MLVPMQPSTGFRLVEVCGTTANSTSYKRTTRGSESTCMITASYYRLPNSGTLASAIKQCLRDRNVQVHNDVPSQWWRWPWLELTPDNVVPILDTELV